MNPPLLVLPPQYFLPSLSELAQKADAADLSRCADMITSELMTFWYEHQHFSTSQLAHFYKAITPLVQINATYEGLPLRESLRQRLELSYPIAIRLATIRALWIAAKHPPLRVLLFPLILKALEDPVPEISTYAAGTLAQWSFPPAAARRVIPILLKQLAAFDQQTCYLPERFQTPPPDQLLSLLDLRQNFPDGFAFAILLVTLGRALTFSPNDTAQQLLKETLWRTPLWLAGTVAGEACSQLEQTEEIVTLLTVARSSALSETRTRARRALTRIGAAIPPEHFRSTWEALLTSTDLYAAVMAAEAVAASRSPQKQYWARNKSWIVQQLIQTTVSDEGSWSESLLQSLDFEPSAHLFSSTETRNTGELNSAASRYTPVKRHKSAMPLPRHEFEAVALFLEDGLSTAVGQRKTEAAQRLFLFQEELTTSSLAGHIYAQSDETGLTLYAETLETILECLPLITGLTRSDRNKSGMMRIGIHAGTLILESPQAGVWRMRENFSLLAKTLARRCRLQQILITASAVTLLPPLSSWRNSLISTGFSPLEAYGSVSLYNLHCSERNFGVPCF